MLQISRFKTGDEIHYAASGRAAHPDVGKVDYVIVFPEA